MESTDRKVGAKVSWEDPYTARQHGEVVGEVEVRIGGLRAAPEYRIWWADGTEIVTDLRQRAWRLES